MRNLILLFLLFSGVMLVSCSEVESTDDSTENEADAHDQELEKEVPETEASDMPENKDALSWKYYHNQRYDFCVGYPSNFLKELGESENNDGNTFATANKSSEMRASGMYNALEQTIKEAFNSATKNGKYYDEERIITYKKQGDNWFVVSGKYYESIFYVRTVLKNDTFYTLYFEYHSSEEVKFKEIIKHTTKDFPDC